MTKMTTVQNSIGCLPAEAPTKVGAKAGRRLRQLKGFTLIEVSISATLLLFTSVVFYWGAVNSLSYLDIAKRQTLAVYACQNKLEAVRNLGLEELDSLDGYSFDDGKGKIRVVGVYDQMRRVEVEYKYDDKREPVKLVRLVVD